MFNTEKIVSFISLAFITIFIILKDKRKLNKLIALSKEPFILINILLVVVFSIYMLNIDDADDETFRRKEATKQALLGLLIALMAHLEMKIAPFWMIWNASYFLNA